jgi:anthranilate phosphoribosyltransferase
VLEELTVQLARSISLSDEQATAAISQLLHEQVSTEIKARFLTALARKGETAAELGAFARELRAKCISPPLDAETRRREILDVCGTGGDRLGTFNISTTVALIAASAGITVAKHGNRAITSQAGSADVLEALGIKIDLRPEEAAQSLRDHHFAFFFAPKYHPTFQQIGPARKLCAERGQRTIFNFLGPLLNPARPTAQLIGVPCPELCQPVAEVLQSLGARRGMVVSGKVQAPTSNVHRPFLSSGRSDSQVREVNVAELYLDELSTLGENTIAEFYQSRGFAVSIMSPEQFSLQAADLPDLKGGDRAVNAQIVRCILQGTERGPKRDAVLLNASAALLVAGRSKTLSDAWSLAAELIDSGQAYRKLQELVAASAA